MKSSARFAAFFTILGLSGFLAACGGGGSGPTPPQPLSITTTSLPGGDTGTPYTTTITATGGTTPYSFSIASGSLPQGLALSSSGTISGTPSSPGTSNFTVQVVDSSSPQMTATANLSIAITKTQLTITSPPTLPSATSGVAYSYQILTTGGLPPITFALDTGSQLPNGLTLSSSGLISGTANTPGFYNFTITATDSSSPPETASQPFSLTVTPGQLMITTTTLPSGYLGVPYSAQLQASGGVPPYTFSTNAIGLQILTALGLSLSPSGEISGTPIAIQNNPPASFKVIVTDSLQEQAEATVHISIFSAATAFLKGQYAFQMGGLDGTDDPLAHTGTFTADGQGNITTGYEDTNDNGRISQGALAGTYSFSTSNVGILDFTSSALGNQTFVITMNSQGKVGSLIEFDLVNYGSGTFQTVDSADFSLGSLAGNFAYGLITNIQPRTQRSGQVGRFTLDSSGNLSQGAADSNLEGVFSPFLQLTGSFSAPSSSTGRGLASLTPGSQSTINLVYYIVNSNNIYAMEEDSGTASVYSGSIQTQSGQFGDNSLSGPTILAMNGIDTGGAVVFAGEVTANSTTQVTTGEFDENDSGTDILLAQQFSNGSYSVAANGRGQLTIADSTNTYFNGVFYLTGTNTGFVLDDSASNVNYTLFGNLQPQSGTVTQGPSDGNYYGGTTPPVPDGSPVISSVANVTATLALSAGTMTGSAAASDLSIILLDGPISGSYSTSTDSFGRGTFTSTGFPGFGNGNATIYMVSPTQFVLLTTNPTAGAINPNLSNFITQ
jgi:hypothetical protein